ncbi:hypothetical protein BGZ61DRAFT_169614 [Ilyonectria robusta]|uniref:uncharacterized protein n=1 Tax=Ilyonectria robusta TaxID=1079257 RepID=UPI001E8CD9C5|nr:uncharacterized protein BGZ61DRAFT_169614 [Ilyonectria robusta]KAH8734034.1 hypothetical protein BGZ61DRAFT_169614 [Ilyonectria robusta]
MVVTITTRVQSRMTCYMVLNRRVPIYMKCAGQLRIDALHAQRHLPDSDMIKQDRPVCFVTHASRSLLEFSVRSLLHSPTYSCIIHPTYLDRQVVPAGLGHQITQVQCSAAPRWRAVVSCAKGHEPRAKGQECAMLPGLMGGCGWSEGKARIGSSGSRSIQPQTLCGTDSQIE